MSAISVQVGPDVVCNVKTEQVDNANSGWIHPIASLMAILCSIAVGCVSHGSLSRAPFTSQDVVTHDYIYRVEEHLKGSLSKLTDWCVAEIQQQRKRAGEQEKKLEQLLERVLEQEKLSADESARKDVAEQSAWSQPQCRDAVLGSETCVLGADYF